MGWFILKILVRAYETLLPKGMRTGSRDLFIFVQIGLTMSETVQHRGKVAMEI